MIWFPVPARVAVQQSVARRPIRAAISTLRGNGCDLFPASQVDLQPLIMIAVQRRPAPSAWRKCTTLDCLSYRSGICLHLFHARTREKQNTTEVSLAFCKCYVCSLKRVLKGTTWGGRELQDKLQQPCNLPKPAFMDLAAGVHCAWSISCFLCGASWVGVFYSKICIFLSSFRQLMWL